MASIVRPYLALSSSFVQPASGHAHFTISHSNILLYLLFSLVFSNIIILWRHSSHIYSLHSARFMAPHSTHFISPYFYSLQIHTSSILVISPNGRNTHSIWPPELNIFHYWGCFFTQVIEPYELVFFFLLIFKPHTAALGIQFFLIVRAVLIIQVFCYTQKHTGKSYAFNK